MKKYLLHLITVAAFLFAFSGSLFAQTVMGILRDGTTGDPMPGIDILVNGIATDVSTGPDGSYSITVDVNTAITLSASSALRRFYVYPGINLMNLWVNPPSLPSDYDGNYYKTVIIGSQEWMAENFKTTRYIRGKLIGLTTFMYGQQDGQWPVGGDETNVAKYGRLYAFMTFSLRDSVCPVGWRLAKYGDWKKLTFGADSIYSANSDYKDSEIPVAKTLASTTDWIANGTDGTVGNNPQNNNITGFTALPAGSRLSDGTFGTIGEYGNWWMIPSVNGIATATISAESNNLTLHTNIAFTPSMLSQMQAGLGYSIRCLRDLPIPTLITAAVSSITQNAASAGGNVSSDGGFGITTRGVCWDTHPNPTINNRYSMDMGMVGNGIGIFSIALAGLSPDSLYYIRAYATNEKGTSYGQNISFTTPACPTITIGITSTDVSCFNGALGVATATPSGGTAPYTYSWNTSPVQNTATATNLTAGPYTVIVTDKNGCTGTTTVNISQPAVLSATVGGTNVTCFGANDGTINIKDPQGGHGTYEYRLNTGPWQAGPQFSFSNLAPANYSVQIRDASFPSCTITLNNALTITQPNVLSATVGGRNVTCFGANDGTISIKSPSGGQGTYEYSINGGISWQSSGSFIGLSPKSYTVQIRDALYTDCVVTLDNAHVITQPTVLSATVAYSDVTCNGANDGTITFTNPSGGYGTYEYSLGTGSWQSTGSFTGLSPATYSLQIRDGIYPTCILILGNQTITDPEALSATVVKTDVTCNGANDGIITITSPLGGWGTYEYSINGGGTWLLSGTFTNLAPSIYSVQIRDAAHTNCTKVLNNALSITQPAVLDASGTVISQSCNSCKDAAINLAVSGGTLPYTFAWTGPDGYSSSNQTITSLKPGSYSVVVTDAHGCSKKVYAEVINPFVVTNTGDANEIGTLRYAINYANAHYIAAPNLITFNIPLSLPSTIQPGSTLPDIIHPLVIDGYSQQGTSLTDLILSIELEGSKAGAATNGLTIKSNNCTVKGLIIDGFTENGIQVASGTGNTISANSIFNNDALGIDLGANSVVTPNDVGDGDTGSNNLQNFPVLGNLSFSPGNVTVTGTLNSLPSALTYKLEFFANKVADNTGYGEGQTYLGSTTVTTDAGGNSTFTVTLPTLTKYGDVITATSTDPSGNTSEFSQAIGGLQDQILSSTKIPFHYQVNGQGVKSIPSTVVVNEVISAFGNWTGIATSSMSFINDKTTTPPPQYASASDNINLVTFTDDKFPFSPGILAVTAKTLKIGTNDTEAQIMDADIVFNPYFVNNSTYDFGIADNPLYPGFFDIQNVTTHEIGHILGLLHSGVYSATMWFEVGPGITDRSLEQDDKSWLSYRYPDKTKYDLAFGSISGNIKYGYNNDPVAGAIVLAVDPVTNLAVVHAYSDVNGNYIIPGLPPGSYRVYIMPLDGEVYGRDLRPGNISPYIYANTFYTDYPGEFYNYPDLAVESNPTPTPVTVIAGKETSGINFLTNKDVTAPTVKSVVPASGTTGVSVLPNILITFSEPVDMSTLTGQSCYLTKAGSSTIISGNYQPAGFEDNSDIILFTLPGITLDYGSDYTLHITTGVTDLKTNQLGGVYTSTFHTEVKDIEPPTIKSTIPENNAVNIFLTDKIIVFFSEPMIKSTVESSFTLTTDNGTARIDCSTSWDGYTTFTLSPKSPLIEGKKYLLTWRNTATDLSGNGIAAGSINFTTIPASPPTITYLEPGTDLMTNVAVETAIVVDFSEPINTATINSTTFKLLVGTTTQQVSGTFEFLNENSRVVFRPAANLGFGQTYSINLTSGIKDVSTVTGSFAGKNATFTTGTKPSKPHIDYIDPLAGSITNEIFIAGSGFDPNPAKNKVTFSGLTSSGVYAFAHEASLSWIKVYIPYGAVSGAIRITVNGVLDDQDPSNLSTYIYIGSITDPCNTATGNIGTGSKPRDGAVDFNAANAYITNSEDNSVSVITNLDNSDPTHNGPYELTRIQVGTTPMKIEIDPKGTRAYVTNFDSHNVSVIDLTDANGEKNQVVQTIDVGLKPFGVVAYGDKVYVANYGSDNITVINADPTSGGFDHAVDNINTGTHNRDCDISPDGGTLLVTGEKGLTLIKMTKTASGFDYAVSNSNSGTSTRDVAVRPNGATAIVTTNDGGIFFVDIAPGDNFGAAYGNTNPGSKPGDGKVTFDGAYYYVTNPDDNKVTVYKITYEGSGSGSGTISSSVGLTLKQYATINVGDSPEGIAMDAASDKAIVVNSGSNNITPITICCPAVKTASDYIKELAFTLQQLMYQGTLTRTSAGMLIGRLNDAVLNILRKQPKTAVNNMNTFINKVNSLLNSHKLDQTTGKDLIKIAEKIISMLQNPITTKSVMSETSLADNEQTNQGLILVSKLGVIFPNPSSQSITINYQVGEDIEAMTKVQIMVYDINGRVVSTLVDKMMQQGIYTESWTGIYDDGTHAPYGTYFVLFRAGGVEEVSKIMLLKPR